MTKEHPITPPPELVQQWIESTRANDCIGAYPQNYEHLVATQAARWGADQELEACCEWLELHYPHVYTTRLKRCRRPEPPSLKEQALRALEEVDDTFDINDIHHEAIARALAFLPD